MKPFALFKRMYRPYQSERDEFPNSIVLLRNRHSSIALVTSELSQETKEVYETNNWLVLEFPTDANLQQIRGLIKAIRLRIGATYRKLPKRAQEGFRPLVKRILRNEHVWKYVRPIDKVIFEQYLKLSPPKIEKWLIETQPEENHFDRRHINRIVKRIFERFNLAISEHPELKKWEIKRKIALRNQPTPRRPKTKLRKKAS